MATERWQFVQEYLLYTARTYFRIKVDGKIYCDIGFPEAEDYTSVIDTCICMVEGDPDYAGRRVVSTYLNVEEDEISFHMGTAQPGLDER